MRPGPSHPPPGPERTSVELLADVTNLRCYGRRGARGADRLEFAVLADDFMIIHHGTVDLLPLQGRRIVRRRHTGYPSSYVLRRVTLSG